MIGTLVVAVLSVASPLSKAETAMLEALRIRDVSKVKSLMNKQMNLFTIIDGREGKLKAGPYEAYLVAIDTLQVKETSDTFKIGLERLAKIIEFSRHKGETDAQYRAIKLKSKHNDVTKNTIRGLIKPDDYWEIHYDIARSGKIVIQRICEFDHASKFVW